MKYYFPLLFFLFHLPSIAQIDVTGNWNPINNMDLQYNFEKDQLEILTYYSNVRHGVKSYKFTRSKNKLFLTKNRSLFGSDYIPVDTISIIERNDSLLQIYQYSTKEKLLLLQTDLPKPPKKLPKELVPKRDVRGFIRSKPSLDIHFTENGKETIVYKRYGKYYNKTVGYFENARFDRSKSALDYGLINQVLHYQDSEDQYQPQRISNDTLFGKILDKKIDVKLIEAGKSSKSIDDLIGTWIILKDKAKFDAVANKKSKTVYIGHTQLKILKKNNEAFYILDGKNFENKNIRLETIHGVDFLWAGGWCPCDPNDARLDKLKCNFDFHGKIEKMDERRFILHPSFSPELSGNGMSGMTIEPLYFVRIN